MAIVIPPSKNYPNPIVAIPSRWQQTPIEGYKTISIEVDWATMGGPGNSVHFSFSNNATISFSQFVAVTVDNSACGSDIRFIFPDTATTLTVPAYESGTFPVFTGSLEFYLVALDPLNVDVSSFVMHNAMPPLVSNPKSEFQESGDSGTLILTAPWVTQVIPSSVSGTLEALFLSAVVANPSSDWTVFVTYQDGDGRQIAPTVFGGKNMLPYTGTPINLTGLNIRFNNGLQVSSLAGSIFPSLGEAIASAIYRSP